MADENDYAPGWTPSPGDQIEGKVIGLDARERKKPRTDREGHVLTHYPILTIEASDGTQTAVHAFHGVLEDEIKNNFNASEIVGSNIKIRYDGEKTTRDGENTYHLYKVFGGSRRAAQVVSVLGWGDAPPLGQQAFATASTGPVTPSVPASASHAPLTTEDLGGPLPPSNEPSTQQKAAETFGSEAPF
jgi:hypothetical protein